MSKQPDAETRARGEAFRDALIALCQTHGFYPRWYRIEYDEYDSDEGYEIVPIKHVYDLNDLAVASVTCP